VVGRVEVARHRERERAVRRDAVGERRQQVEVSRHPLERGSRDQQVDRGVGSPLAQVVEHVVDAAVGVTLAGALHHLRRRVDASHAGVRPAGEQDRRRLAGPAPEVDDLPRVGVDPSEQLVERSDALVGEAQIGLGIPSDGHDSQFISMSRFLT